MLSEHVNEIMYDFVVLVSAWGKVRNVSLSKVIGKYSCHLYNKNLFAFKKAALWVK